MNLKIKNIMNGSNPTYNTKIIAREERNKVSRDYKKTKTHIHRVNAGEFHGCVHQRRLALILGLLIS